MTHDGHIAGVVTIGASLSSIAFWGLNVNEICAIISTLTAVCSFAFQVYSARRKRR